MNKVTIHSPRDNARIRYTLDYVFGTCLKMEWTLIKSDSKSIMLISYNNQEKEFGFFDEVWQIREPKEFVKKLIENCLLADDLYQLPKEQDPLAIIFFLISRYEEYLHFEIDKHGRFKFENSVLHTCGRSHEAIVNRLVVRIAEQLAIPVPKKQDLKIVAGFDVDHYSWIHKKPFFDAMKSILKSFFKFKIGEVGNKKLAYFGWKKDPYNTYTELMEQCNKASVTQNWFFLLGNYGGVDSAPGIENSLVQKTILEISKNHKVGIHPSGLSNNEGSILKKEIEDLRQLTKQEIIKSRQHYLYLAFPNTYRSLIENGIFEDHTLMFAEKCGFRASTSIPFFWYDLYDEKVTKLKIIPPCVMDVSLRFYQNMEVPEASQYIKQLKEEAALLNGTFSFIWHNSSFSFVNDWNEYKPVFEQLIAKKKA